MTESERRSPQPVLLGNRLTSQSGLARIRKPKQRERERLEKQHMQGDHLFPHLCSLSFIHSRVRGRGGVHTLRCPLSFTLTWSGAVLRSFASHFLQTAVVHFLQQPSPPAPPLVFAVSHRRIHTWNQFLPVKHPRSQQSRRQQRSLDSSHVLNHAMFACFMYKI